MNDYCNIILLNVRSIRLERAEKNSSPESSFALYALCVIEYCMPCFCLNIPGSIIKFSIKWLQLDYGF